MERDFRFDGNAFVMAMHIYTWLSSEVAYQQMTLLELMNTVEAIQISLIHLIQ
jgi:hypothetical protein